MSVWKHSMPGRVRLAGLLSLVLVCLAVIGLAGQPACAATPVETYVQTNVQKGMAILNNKSLSDDEMRTQFRQFLETLTDMRRIALFTLGPARRTAPQADQDAFVQAFRDYADAVYESRLSDYSGQSLKVTGSTERAPNDWVVNTTVVESTAKSGQAPIEVAFRVNQDNGHYVVVDAAVAGIWLGIEERDQFTAFLAQHNNDVKALITHLQQLTQALRSKKS